MAAHSARLVPAFVFFSFLRFIVPLATLARLAWRKPSRSRDRAAEDAVAAAAMRLRRLPNGDRRCLAQSLTLYRALARYGADPELFVGFRRTAGRLEGHAWVEVAGAVVGDTADHVRQFEAMCRFGTEGRLVPVAHDATTGHPGTTSVFR